MIVETLKAKLEKVLWEDSESVPRWRRALLGPARILYAVVRDLAEGQINLRAMSLVYTTLLSLVPLLAITFSVLKGFGVQNQVEPLLLRAFEPLGEQGAEIAERIIGFVNNMQVGVLGSVGLGLLIFTVISLMQKIEESFNFIWHVSQLRGVGEGRFIHTIGGDEGGRLAVAKRDRAGLVQEQHVHVASRFYGTPAGGHDVAPDQPVNATDADGAQQAANRGRNQADEQGHQHKYSLRRTRVNREWL